MHPMRSIATSFILLFVVAGCSLPSGLLRFRWAMEDPDYAEKYAEGVPKSDVLGKLKQASDARFLSDVSGIYVSTGVAARSDAARGLLGADIGVERYITSFYTARGSLLGMTDGEDYFTGLDLGLRLQSPSRLAPFVGIGGFAGYAKESVSAERDGVDNDEDGFADEWGEEHERVSGAMAAAYPEIGVHLWWTPRVRLTGLGRYLFTTEGRDADDWWLGAGIAMFAK